MKTYRTIAAGMMVAVAALAAAGCQSTQEVRRVDPEEVYDLDHRFDEDDARITARTMVDDALSRPWVDRWMATHDNQPPVMIVGNVRNNTSDYIDTALFTKQIERALLNSGRVAIVASSDERGQVREERAQQQDWSRPETVRRMAYELGADYMLVGRVGENVEIARERNRRIQYFQVNLELVDIESNQVVWIGEQQIEKRITR